MPMAHSMGAESCLDEMQRNQGIAPQLTDSNSLTADFIKRPIIRIAIPIPVHIKGNKFKLYGFRLVL